MKEKIKHYTKEILIFVVVMTIIANLMSLYRSTELNKKAFDSLNISLLNSQNFQASSEKPLLVHFWATWCPTCKLEASNIQTISESFDLLTVAVKSGSDKEITNFLQENNLDFKVHNDENAILASEYSIAAYPTTLIYDKNKNLVFSEVGYASTWGLWLRMWWASF